MDSTWIKLYRKSKDNPLMRDFTAWGIFTWILLTVHKDTGEMTLGRLWASKYFSMNPSTFYKALKRLEKKYKVVTQSSNNQFTTVRVLNWAKYQYKILSVTQSSNNEVTTNSQRSNNEVTHIQEVQEVQEVKNNIPVDKQRDSLPGISLKKPRTENQEKYDKLIAYLEGVLDTKFTNYPKQAAAIKKMFTAGYTENQIQLTIRGMNSSDFYRDKGFDMTTVMNEIPRYKARMRKRGEV